MNELLDAPCHEGGNRVSFQIEQVLRAVRLFESANRQKNSQFKVILELGE
ncbi:MAG: hypothetical protein IH623_17490 [Verrucomicrobia bacterium]|nr:hypothetical protein [Verrucomicrobiota bacterium]